MIQNYLGKISRPVLDRIDIQVEMPQLSYEEISSAKKGEPSSAVLERIMKAREIQQKAFCGYGNTLELQNSAIISSRNVSYGRKRKADALRLL